MPKSTKNQIMNALAELLQTKRLDDITVTELVEQCGLSRQAFYYHFSDLYALRSLVVPLHQGVGYFIAALYAVASRVER